MLELINNYDSKTLKVHVFSEGKIEPIDLIGNIEEYFLFKITLDDGILIFNQKDQIWFGEKTVYFKFFRVEEVYTKDNGSIDAKSNYSFFALKYDEILTVSVIEENDKSFLCFNLKNGNNIISVGIPKTPVLNVISKNISKIISLKCK